MAMRMVDARISVREALRAARAVRRAEHGRGAYNTVRPHGLAGVTRARPPLFVVLWVAAQDGRLVWQDVDGFALLEPPRSEKLWRAATGDPRVPLLRFTDRHWETLVLAVPPALAMLLALGLGLSFRGSTVALTAALLLVLVAVSYFALLMTLMLVRQPYDLIQTFARRRDEKRKTIDNAPFVHWTLPLCHQRIPGRARALIDQVSERLHRLILSNAGGDARQRGARMKPLNVEESLACLLSGATTKAARQALVAATAEPHAIGPGAKIAFLASFDRAPAPEHRLLDSGAFVFLYLTAMALAIPASAGIIADWEQQACAPQDCAERPTDYTSALVWTASQLLGWTVLRAMGWDLRGPVAHSPQAVILGWLLSLPTPLLPFVARAAIRQNRRWRGVRRSQYTERRASMTAKTKVLIIVASEVEHRAVRDAVTAASDSTPRQEHFDGFTGVCLGTLSAADVWLAVTGQGSLAPDGSAFTTQVAEEVIQPDYLILTGIGYGLMPDEQQIGEVMVSTQLRVMDHKEVVDPSVPGDPPIEFLRGSREYASPTLLSRARVAAQYGWNGPRIIDGPMLTLNTRVSSPDLHEYLRTIEPDAIGGDMEGSGFYAASARARADWIVIKGISDWGGHGGTNRDVAARSAAEFVVHLIQSRGLNQPSARRRSY